MFFIFRHAGEILLHHLDRVWPLACRVRKIGAPQQLIVTDAVASLYTYRPNWYAGRGDPPPPGTQGMPPMSTLTRSLLTLLGLGVALGAGPLCGQAPQERLDARLRQLEKDIAAVRGLPFKQPVVARIIPRPPDAGKQVQGYYSIKDKTLFLYDDLTQAYERGVLVHEMVHALQDQHFGLAKLHPTDFDGDADLARSALIEGDATFTMIEVLQKEQPHVAKMLNTSLEKSKNLRNAFLYGIGARYVQGLKKLCTNQNKVFSRKRSGSCAAFQRAASAAVKRARFMALLPYVGE